MIELYVTATFEAAHTLPSDLGFTTLHGHSYWLRVFYPSSADHPLPQPSAQAYVNMIASRLDHRNLNDLMEQPTMEAIAEWVAQNIQGPKPSRIQVWRESIGCGVEWR